MFKIAKIKLIPDPEMYIFFEKGTRGEISSISNRYIKVNNKYLKPYDIKKNKNIFIYTLPTSGFKWTDPKEFQLNKYTSNSSKGCVLEVDLEYPTELRELQNNYPLATDKIRIKREVLSDYLLKIANLYSIPIADSAANKGWSMVHYHQSSDFDCPCIVCIGVSTPSPHPSLKNTTLLLFSRSPLNLQTVHVPPF